MTAPPTSTPALSDQELVKRILAGQRDAYATLVRRHQAVAYRHARGMGIDHDSSLDLVQDGFVRAYTRLGDCRDPAHFRAWLLRIVRNLCLDYLKNVRRQSVPFSALPDVESIADNDEQETVLSRTLRNALGSLPYALREAFLLHHDAGFTYDEVAEMTKATPSAVKMRVHRAREALRSFLIENGVRATSDNSARADRLQQRG